MAEVLQQKFSFRDFEFPFPFFHFFEKQVFFRLKEWFPVLDVYWFSEKIPKLVAT